MKQKINKDKNKESEMNKINYELNGSKEFSSSYLDAIKFQELFERIFDIERSPERIAEFKSELSKYDDIENRIKFCKDFKQNYLNALKAPTFMASGMTFAHTNIKEGTALFFDDIVNREIDSLEAELINQKNTGKREKYICKEIALAYILEIYATGKTTPKAPQGNAKKVLENIGESEFNVKGDSFYRAVKDILNVYDVNIEDDLNQISKNWYNAIKEISTKRNKWDIINEYLKTKGIPKG